MMSCWDTKGPQSSFPRRRESTLCALLNSRTASLRLLLLLTTALFHSARVHSQELPLEFDQRYDEVILSSGTTARVFPLDANLKPGETPLRVRMLDYPDQQFDVDWSDVKRIRRFNEIVVDRAMALLNRKQREDAYRMLAYVRRSEPDSPALARGIVKLLKADVVAAFRNGQVRESFLAVDELLQRDARQSGLAVQLADRTVTRSLEQGNLRDVQFVLQWVQQRGFDADDRITDWTKQVEAKLGGRLAEAEAEWKQKNYRAALDKVQVVLRMWPEQRRAIGLRNEILKDYPTVVVGVTRLGAEQLDYIYDWATLRTRRLVGRSLVELSEYGRNGGNYTSPIGQLSIDEDQQGAIITLANSFQEHGADLAQQLERFAAGQEIISDPAFGRMVESIRYAPGRGVRIRLNQLPLRWLPHLELPLTSDLMGAKVAGYRRSGATDNEQVFLENDDYFWDTTGRVVEIVERTEGDLQALELALTRGQIDVIDRITPAMAARLRRSSGIKVGDFTFPSSYFLVPNMDQELINDRNFRRAIAYGIQRQSILQSLIPTEGTSSGCRILTGPFPAETRRDDDMAYAYDTSIPRRTYEPQLASALATMSAMQRMASDPDESAAADGTPDETVGDEQLVNANASNAGVAMEPLRLAVPQDALLLVQARAIARSLTQSGIQCELRKLPSGSVRPDDDEWDLWLIDASFHEPIVDIQRMFGPVGLVRNPSPYLAQALLDLAQVRRWPNAESPLQEVHQLVHDELSLIPLWQLSNHFAYRDTLQNVPSRPVNLYDGVERWRVTR